MILCNIQPWFLYPDHVCYIASILSLWFWVTELSDVFNHVTQLQSDFTIIVQVTLKLSDVINYVTLKLGDVIDHVTQLELNDLIDHITLKVEWLDHSLDQPLYAEFLATDFIIFQKIKVSFSSNSYSHIKKWLFMENLSFPLNRENTVYFIPFDLKIYSIFQYIKVEYWW